MTSIDPDGRLHPGRAGVYPETSSPISSARRLEIAISRPTAPLRIRGCDPFICICICSFGRGCILHACLQKLQRPCQQRLRPLRLQRQLQALQRPLHPRRPLQRLRPLRLQRQLQALQRPLHPQRQALQRLLLLPLRLRPRLRPCRLQRLRPLRLQRQLQALQWPLPPRPLQLPRQLEPRHVRQIRMWIPKSPWRWGGL